MTQVNDAKLAEIMRLVYTVLPNAVVDEDLDGQLVIYTGAELNNP